MTLRAHHLALVACTLVACADPIAPRGARPDAADAPALAKGGTLVTRDVFDVTFAIDGAGCGLPSDVEGAGVFKMQNRALQLGPGAWRVAFNWSAHGTAVGDDGTRYRFNYAANGKYVDIVADPTALPVPIEFVDHFNLISQGAAPDLRVFLRGRFMFDGFNIVPIGDPVIRGGIECDPI
ncbi:hypothetical protein [Roseisolibacter sp. H3M3-2]|uniref:hypothetical protein n=1 Tax=Roseisolibacter sp. H3M3-2 TaxID=3031323 RepID=UPI0023DAD75D|nr:hypothetical protein [Roseisolibacter sp. H3M3-2]MDF1503818.1 hypothetical protein [Roseisolibacter sp. H3M3-2]